MLICEFAITTRVARSHYFLAKQFCVVSHFYRVNPNLLLEKSFRVLKVLKKKMNVENVILLFFSTPAVQVNTHIRTHDFGGQVDRVLF